MGPLDTGDLIMLLVAVATVAVCVRVGAESVGRVRGHRLDHPSALLGLESRDEEQALRRSYSERRYALVEAAGTRIRAGARLGGEPDADGGAPTPVRVVDDLDRALALLNAEEESALARVQAGHAGRLAVAERERARAWWLDVACAGTAVLLAGGSVGAAVAALL
ncbi:hypothetical protein DFP74_1825 [Nocardiopsis sp. Huas11]|uniref:hypothetical protein n=1 Tax=Nocardiopsis sp. Huas11 TaxID=2183912 RepID=UPI000EACD04D|nr:hypothetical protein [Nocardiopsis sp. Huas11]RKS06201.1 hypothetical protein DFP74_1825 [Nocardiopsis sp. Huas11]